MRICDLRNKPVLNAKDCNILGNCTDIEFDECNGCIKALIIPGPGRICGLFGRDCEYVIPFHCVKAIGNDAVLVDVCLERCVNKCF